MPHWLDRANYVRWLITKKNIEDANRKREEEEPEPEVILYKGVDNMELAPLTDEDIKIIEEVGDWYEGWDDIAGWDSIKEDIDTL